VLDGGLFELTTTAENGEAYAGEDDADEEKHQTSRRGPARLGRIAAASALAGAEEGNEAEYETGRCANSEGKAQLIVDENCRFLVAATHS
jgi:hypothetical protein